MQTYDFSISQLYSQTITVEAHSEEEVWEKAQEILDNGDYTSMEPVDDTEVLDWA